MFYESQDIFSVLDVNSYFDPNLEISSIVITTNCILNNIGDLVMGAGVAKAAKEKWPELPNLFGKQQKEFGYLTPRLLTYHTTFGEGGWPLLIFGVPTKIHWKDNSNLNLIQNSIIELVQYHNSYNKQGKKCLIPKLGCSNGGLNWDDVRPIMEEYLDDRFVCCLGENL